MECIHCTQCADACDDIMERVGKPKGLIRYSSREPLEGHKRQLIRPRTVLYPLALAVFLAFTAAATVQQPITGAPRADKIVTSSDATRNVVLDMLARTAASGTAAQKNDLSAAFNHPRPDGQKLAQALAQECALPQMITRLKTCGMTG